MPHKGADKDIKGLPMHTASQHAYASHNARPYSAAQTAAPSHAVSRLATYAPHTAIFDEGEPANAIYEMIEGAAMLYKLLPDGRRQVVELIGPGDFFGVGEEPETDCGAETVTTARVRCHDRRSSENCATFQMRLMSQLRRRVHVIHEHTALLGRKLAVSRQEIADYLGLTIETVSRSFTELRRRGAIRLERQDTVRILDRAAMEVLSGSC